MAHGSMIGFGTYHYRYDSGREGDAPAASFAPRSTACVVYLMDGVERHAPALARLGPHTTGVGCLYLKRLADVDLAVLGDVVADSYRRLTSGVFRDRAHGRRDDP